MAKQATSAQVFRDLDIREKVRRVKELRPDLSLAEIGRQYGGFSHTHISHIGTLEKLRGPDGESIKNAIDQSTISLAKVAREIQSSRDEDIRDVQRRLLGMCRKGIKIKRGLITDPMQSDRRRTNSGRSKGKSGHRL